MASPYKGTCNLRYHSGSIALGSETAVILRRKESGIAGMLVGDGIRKLPAVGDWAQGSIQDVWIGNSLLQMGFLKFRG